MCGFFNFSVITQENWSNFDTYIVKVFAFIVGNNLFLFSAVCVLMLICLIGNAIHGKRRYTSPALRVYDNLSLYLSPIIDGIDVADFNSKNDGAAR